MPETVLMPTQSSIELCHSIERMKAMGWSDEQLIEYRYAERVPRDSKRAREYLSSIETPEVIKPFDHKHVFRRDDHADSLQYTIYSNTIKGNNIKGNNIMLKQEELKAPLAEITTIFGQRLDEMSEQDFLNAVERTEVQIEKLKAFKTKSKKIEQSIRKLEDDLAKIVDYYDAT